jgi:hypothetical protein
MRRSLGHVRHRAGQVRGASVRRAGQWLAPVGFT